MSARLEKIVADKMIAQLCRESYYQFFLEFVGTVFAEKLVNNWHIEYQCNELQIAAERVFCGKPKEYDILDNCPPGTSKSTIFSILFNAWVWTRMPSARFITGSHNEGLSLDLARKTRDVVESEKYQRYFPEVQLRSDQNAKGYFTTTQGGFRKAVGVGGGIIGFHAHFLIIDDPIDPLGALSDIMLKEANDWMRETLSQRKVDKQISVTALVMQRLHQADPTGDWLERGGKLKHICLPADCDEWPVQPEECKRYYVDGLFDPSRLNRDALEEAQKTLGDVGYAGQYGQQPSPRGGSLFRVDRLLIEPAIPLKWRRGPVRFWDKAASQGQGSWTVGVKMALDHQDRFWVLDVQRFRLESGGREQRILAVAALDGKQCRIGIEQEPGGGGKESALSAQKAYGRAGFRSYIDVVRGSKEERAGDINGEIRADTFAAQVNTYNIVLVPAPWNETFIDELRLFPNSKYKDQVDATVGAYNMLAKARLRIGTL